MSEHRLLDSADHRPGWWACLRSLFPRRAIVVKETDSEMSLDEALAVYIHLTSFVGLDREQHRALGQARSIIIRRARAAIANGASHE